MATKITDADKIRINELYIKYHTYAAVARETGFAASTVKKYVIPNYIPQTEIQIKKFTIEELPEEIDYFALAQIEDLGAICVLSDEEKEEVRELWKELII